VTAGEKAGVLLIGVIVLDDFLDFVVPGRWQRKAIKRAAYERQRLLKKNAVEGD
jgi:hypothetical protein